MRQSWRALAAILLIASWWPLGCAPAKPMEASAQRTDVWSQFQKRLTHVRREIPAITTAAEAVARRWVDSGQSLLQFPFGGDTSNFTMEMIARAGGLDNAQPSTQRVALRSKNDVVVVGPRSWEKGADFLQKELTRARQDGWLIVVFGSKAGMPQDIPFDFLIDNGAVDGSEKEAAVNQIVNITQAWMWSCEVTSALTRLDQRPGILKGMVLPGSTEHNKQYQNGDAAPKLYPCDTPIAPGKLAREYLQQLLPVLNSLRSKSVQAQINHAAELSVQHLRHGKGLWAASFTHVLDGEVFWNNQSPIQAFRAISCGDNGETFTQNLKPGDLLLFFGEWTLNLPWRDYLKIIRSTQADYIPSFRPGTEPFEPCEGDKVFYDLKVDDALMVLEQHWPYENAVVDIPFPPGKMAPVSGVYVCLMYRMLDQAIAHRLAQQPLAVPANR